MVPEVGFGNPGKSCVPKRQSHFHKNLSFPFLGPYSTPIALLHTHVPLSGIQQLYSGPAVSAKSRQHSEDRLF